RGGGRCVVPYHLALAERRVNVSGRQVRLASRRGIALGRLADSAVGGLRRGGQVSLQPQDLRCERGSFRRQRVFGGVDASAQQEDGGQAAPRVRISSEDRGTEGALGFEQAPLLGEHPPGPGEGACGQRRRRRAAPCLLERRGRAFRFAAIQGQVAER